MSEAYIVFCNSALPWITLPRNSKQACHAHCRVVVRKSMVLEGSIVSPNKKISFKVFMYINTWTYLHKYFSWIANGLFPYDDIRHLFCHFTSFLPSRCTSFFPTLLEFSPRFFWFPLHSPSNIEMWSTVPTDTCATQLLHWSLRDHCRRRDARVKFTKRLYLLEMSDSTPVWFLPPWLPKHDLYKDDAEDMLR